MEELFYRSIPLQAGSGGDHWAGSWIYLAEVSTSIFSQINILVHSFPIHLKLSGH